MEDKPRYSRTTDLIDILIMMQAKSEGVSLADIMKVCSVSRRTAERMRDALLAACPAIEELENIYTREKHWGFRNYSMKDIVNFTPEELAYLETNKKQQQDNGFEDKERILSGIIDKIRVLSKKRITNLDNTLEMIMQTEGFAVKQTPKFKIDIKILETIRTAIKENRKITAKYNNKFKILAPYGLIYGEKVYLIGVETEKGENPYCYLLHKFSDVKLSKENFDKGDFNLDEFSKKSFGVYQSDCMSVKLLFDRNVADEVLNYNFHSTQKIKQNPDGSVTVKLKASGEYEMMWHLFKWGNNVKILSPKSLKQQYIDLLTKTLNNAKE